MKHKSAATVTMLSNSTAIWIEYTDVEFRRNIHSIPTPNNKIKLKQVTIKNPLKQDILHTIR